MMLNLNEYWEQLQITGVKMNKKLPITSSNSTESICFFFIKLSKKNTGTRATSGKTK